MDTAAHEFGTKFLSTPELAELLGVSTRTLEDYRLRGCGPPFVRLSGRAVRYRPRAVARWVREREVASTSDPGGVT